MRGSRTPQTHSLADPRMNSYFLLATSTAQGPCNPQSAKGSRGPMRLAETAFYTSLGAITNSLLCHASLRLLYRLAIALKGEKGESNLLHIFTLVC